MCNRCNDKTAVHHTTEAVDQERRAVLATGSKLLATSLLAGDIGLSTLLSLDADAAKAAADGQVGKGWGTRNAKSPLAPVSFPVRALRDDDIQLEILYAGICHSDIHTARGEWGPVDYMVVPGHEIVGRVTRVGPSVTKFKVGDLTGVGCIVNSCGSCTYCAQGLEQFCSKGFTGTYGKAANGEVQYGGYSNVMVVRDKYGIKIPSNLDPRSAAPLMCAAITTFSPQQHWKVSAGQKVGILGFGGLGHMAVKLAVARGAIVTVFTTSPGKFADAKRMGATEAVLWGDKAGFDKYSGTLDFILSTVPEKFDVNPFLSLLKVDGVMVNVGQFGDLGDVDGRPGILGRRTLAGSVIGGIAETQEVVDYCAAHNIAPEVEMISIDQVNKAWDRVVAKDIRYRFVIDMSTMKAG